MGARTIAAPMASRQRAAMVVALLGGHTCVTLRSLPVVCFAHRTEAIPPTLSKPRQTMKTLSLTAKLTALFGGSLLALFVAGLAVEDQRHFVACRASGASADACLLQINGR
jgi:hypothetical protein